MDQKRGTELVRGRIRPAVVMIAVTVGMVLADSSIVTLALPEVLREFDVEVSQVAWVLTAFNLVLAISAVPAARVAQARPNQVLLAGLVLLVVASAACAVADSLDALVAARCLQAVGGAGVVCAGLERLVRQTGSDARAAAIWGAAGIVGISVGPALGGVLTEWISWQAIFVVQVPVAVVAIGVLAFDRSRRESITTPAPGKPERPHVAANLSLLLISAALTAALFLLVLLLIEGWMKQPAVAGLAVSVMPAAALIAGWMAPRLPPGRTRIEAGAIAIAGGLAALGLMPGSTIPWTLVPQILIGAGLGLTIQALTQAALQGRSHQAVHGGWTIASRHAGVVVGLLLLTPVFTHDLEQNSRDAQQAGTALLIDSKLPPAERIELGGRLGEQIRKADGRVPDLAPAFKRQTVDRQDAPELAALETRVNDQLARATTHAFSTSFLLAGVLALLALLPVLAARERVEL